VVAFSRRARQAAKDLTSRTSRPPSTTRTIPTTALLQQILDEFGLLHGIDDDGDLVVRWERCSIYFFHYGDRGEVLQARLYVNERYDVEMRPAIVALLDDWNRTKLFPKAYTVLPDDGRVGICAEHAYDFEVGVARDQLKEAVRVWIQTLLNFADWLEEQI
jgi:hypothetical protein